MAHWLPNSNDSDVLGDEQDECQTEGEEVPVYADYAEGTYGKINDELYAKYELDQDLYDYALMVAIPMPPEGEIELGRVRSFYIDTDKAHIVLRLL